MAKEGKKLSDPEAFDRLHKQLDVTVRCITREDNLRHQRLSWALQVNLALLASLFLVYEGISDRELAEAVFYVGSVMGAVVSGISAYAIRSANRQFSYLKKFIESKFEDYDKAKIDSALFGETDFPRPFGDYDSKSFGFLAPSAFAILFVILWALLFLFTLFGAIPFNPLPGSP